MNKVKEAIEILAAYLGLLYVLAFDLDKIIGWFERHAGGLI